MHKLFCGFFDGSAGSAVAFVAAGFSLASCDPRSHQVPKSRPDSPCRTTYLFERASKFVRSPHVSEARARNMPG